MQFKYHAPVAKRELALGSTRSTSVHRAVSIRTSEERGLYTEEVLYRWMRGEDTGGFGDTGRECQDYEVLRTAPPHADDRAHLGKEAWR